jgi:hypothetical protein
MSNDAKIEKMLLEIGQQLDLMDEAGEQLIGGQRETEGGTHGERRKNRKAA